MKHIIYYFLTIFFNSFIIISSQGQENLNIRMLGEVHDFVNQSYDVAISGNLVYVASGMGSGLRVLDITEPSRVFEIGRSINNDPISEVPIWMADRIKVTENFAYVLYFDGTWAFEHFRLYVYDISLPTKPRQMGYIDLPDNCTSLYADGNYVYITAYDFEKFSGLKIIDVSSPQQPFEVGSFETPGMPQSVTVSDNIAYIADNNSIMVYDVTDPASAEELGNYTSGVEEALIHPADLTNGTYILHLETNGQVHSRKIALIR